MSYILTEEDLIKKKFSSANEMVECIYFYLKENYVTDQLLEKVLETNKKFNMTLDDLRRRILEFRNNVDSKFRNLSIKLERSSLIRYKVKDLSKHLNNTISQSKLKKIIIYNICQIVLIISNKMYSLCFDDDTINNIYSIISDNSLLKYEFDNYIIKSIMNKIEYQSNDNMNLEMCFIDRMAEYYCDYYSNKEQIKEIKEDIDKVMEMTESELEEYHKILQEKVEIASVQYEEEERQYSEELEKKEKEFFNKIENETISKLLERGIFDSEEEGHDIFSSMLNSSENDDIKEVDQVRKHGLQIYKQYFNYKSDIEFFDFNLLEKIYSVYSLRKDNDLQGLKTGELFSIYMSDCTKDYVKRNDLETDSESINYYSYLITHDFFLYLSHSLLSGSKEFKNDFLDICQNLIYENESVVDNYSNIVLYFDKYPHCFNYSPNDMYQNFLVMSVLYEVDTDKKIKKIIKNILIKYYKYIYNSLSEYNKRQHMIYYEDEETSFSYNINEMAVTFMFNYFKDPVYMAPLSVFLFDFRDNMKLYSDYYFSSAIDFDTYYDDINLDDNDKILFDKIDNDMVNVLNQLQDVDISKIEHEIFIKYSNVLYVTEFNLFPCDDIFDCEYLLSKHKKRLILFIYYYMKMEDKKNYLSWSIEQKVELLWDTAINISLLLEIYATNQLIPRISTIKNQKNTHSLENTIEEQKKLLDEQNSEIFRLKKQIQSMKETLDKDVSEKAELLSNFHKEEISILNKKIIKKDNEIKKLKENQNELIKLRELMFELQNSNDDNLSEDSKDYSSYISNILESKKIVIIGGHIKLINIMRQKYPKLAFIGNENKVINQVISNSDYVFFFYNFMNHSLYYKIMGILVSNSNVRWNYISSKNIERVEKELYEKLQSFEV